jgi:hypothetical protein
MWLALLLVASDLSELQRFPRLEAANTHIRLLIDQRYFISLRLSVDRNNAEKWAEALRENGRHLAAWEALLEARGELVEEGGPDDDDFCANALGRLRKWIGERKWAAGEMP